MKKFKNIAPCALSILMGLASTLFPLKSTNVFAEDSSSPPICKEGYEYVESTGKCYKKCADGWERNLETLRCRKVRTDEEPDPSESVSDEPTDGPSSDGSTEDPSSDSPTEDLPEDDPSDDPESSHDEPIEDTAEPEIIPPGTSFAAEPSLILASSEPSVKDTPLETVKTTCKDGYEYVESAGKCYKTCADGWERNLETLRCRKIATEPEAESKANNTTGNSSTAESISSSKTNAAETAKETTAKDLEAPTCKEGYEYVESTGKCYKVCADGQIRNPETNRCKKASSSDSESDTTSEKATKDVTCKEGYEYVESAGKCYKACAEGQERSPETNRCKKVTTSSGSSTSTSSKKTNNGADYSVDVPETGGATAFIAAGSVVALAVAGLVFVIFQYRVEIRQFIKKHFKKA